MSQPRRAILGVAAVLAAMAVLPFACLATGGEGAVPDAGPEAAPLPADFVPGPVFGVPDCCLEGTYVQVDAFDCPRSQCSGTTAYAVCVKGKFGGCSCTQPEGTEDAAVECV